MWPFYKGFTAYAGISLSFGVAGRHCHEPGQIHFFIVYPMDQFINVAGTEGKVGGYFCQLPPLNENTCIYRKGMLLITAKETSKILSEMAVQKLK